MRTYWIGLLVAVALLVPVATVSAETMAYWRFEEGTVGRGMWDGGITDWSDALIDEVRISDEALSPDQFFQSGSDVPPLLGDVNLDGMVNGLDVDPFTGILLGGTYQTEADMNEDGLVNGLDVDPFVVVVAVVGGGAQAVPEPATWLLAAWGLVGLLSIGRTLRSAHRSPDLVAAGNGRSHIPHISSG